MEPRKGNFMTVEKVQKLKKELAHKHLEIELRRAEQERNRAEMRVNAAKLAINDSLGQELYTGINVVKGWSE